MTETKKRKGKLIRALVSVALFLMVLASAAIIRSVLQALVRGEPQVDLAEAPQAGPSARHRAIASIPQRSRKSRPSVSEESPAVTSAERESNGDTTVFTYAAGGEAASPAFAQSFMQYLETGAWPDHRPPSSAASGEPSQTAVPFGNRGSETFSTAPSSSSVTNANGDSSSSGSFPAVSVQAPFFALATGGGINGVTSGGYKVTATSATPLSSVQATTSSNYKVWLNQGGQAVSP